jgi:ParB-like chromosome segregation protein Spo0J
MSKTKVLAAAEWLPLDQFFDWDRNPRDNAEAIPAIAESIKRFGFVSPIVVWEGKNRLVAGHTRMAALKFLLEKNPEFTPPFAPGPGLIPVRQHPFKNEEDANAYAIADNKLAEAANWDSEILVELLQELEASRNVDLTTLGWSNDEFDDLIENLDMPSGLFEGLDLDPDKLERIDGVLDDRAKTIVLVYTCDKEAQAIKTRLNIDDEYNLEHKKMFPVRDLGWAEL